MKSLLSLAFAVFFAWSTFAQKGADVVHSDKPITWLGLDFTMTKFIGSATQFKDAGEITDDAIRDKYAPGWNELFVKEEKKFDVAKYVHRESVTFALEVTEKANNKMKDGFFTEDPNEYAHLTEADITKAVKQYDFKGGKGVGMIIFIEGMSKGKEQATGWLTFVEMNTKSVLQTTKVAGNAGGFGFRNYWAKAFLNILKQAE